MPKISPEAKPDLYNFAKPNFSATPILFHRLLDMYQKRHIQIGNKKRLKTASAKFTRNSVLLKLYSRSGYETPLCGAEDVNLFTEIIRYAIPELEIESGGRSRFIFIS